MDLAFVGIGRMGLGMVSNLLAKGHNVAVWNRNRLKVGVCIERGARAAGSIMEGAATGIVISMLANDEAVEAVTFARDGILSAGKGVLHISSSTISVALTERLMKAHADAGQRFLAAPVMGRPDIAAAGRLSILTAGAKSDIRTAQPLFEAIGVQTIWLGEKPVLAAVAKIALNAGIPALIEMLTEQLRIAGLHGVPESQMLGVIRDLNFGDRVISNYGPMIVNRSFQSGGVSIHLGRKDVGLALAAAEKHEMPLITMLAERMDAAIASGRGNDDWASLGQPFAAGSESSPD